MKQISLGVVAHVDAGKTTLNEAILYHGKVLRKMGRVDHKDAYFDFDSLEKERGITIYAKTGVVDWKNSTMTLVDTPGHVDFSSEMERTLSILDVAVLVISGLDGVQSHSKTIYSLTDHYHLPLFIFVNKMDLALKSKNQLMDELNQTFDGHCVDMADDFVLEKFAMADESLMEEYLETGNISLNNIKKAINTRRVYPVYFGSALKDDGVVELLDGIDYYFIEKDYPKEFGMKIFKVTYDELGTRLCYGKVTGGILSAKQKLSDDEKIDQIRLVSGKKFTLLQNAVAGQIVALKGLNGIMAGDGLGFEKNNEAPILIPYMNYRIRFPKGVDENMMNSQLQMIQQEDPQIGLTYVESLRETHVSLMGEIQLEVLSNIIKNRTGVDVTFDNGSIVYRETITDSVEGVGHFEPLRHYAEVHLRLDPLPRGSGLVFASEVSSDDLSTNWQRLILTHLKEKHHKGVLTGSYIDDIKITVIAGKAHLKHTEGGDFRQATYRAVRQGLKKANSILLEPYFNFEITVKNQYLSRVLFDLDNMSAKIVVDDDGNGNNIITGSAPVRKMQNYQNDLQAATSGSGSIQMSLAGYQESADAKEIIEAKGYDSELDFHNPTGSVFCSHGSGFYVPYDLVEEYMHIKTKSIDDMYYMDEINPVSSNRYSISDAELKSVVDSMGGRNRNTQKQLAQERAKKLEKEKEEKKLAKQAAKPIVKKKKLLLVDGYNMMFGWEKTKGIDFENAKAMVVKDVASYASLKGIKTILVFDGYRQKQSLGSSVNTQSIEIVHTKANQTADSYIEVAVGQYKKDYDIYVASSDGAVQNVIFAQGASRISAREFELELKGLLARAKMN